MEEKPQDSNNLTKFPESDKANDLHADKGALPSAFDLFGPSVSIIKNNLVGFLILVGIPLVLILVGQGPDLVKGAHAGNTVTINGGLGTLAGIGGILALIAGPGVIVMELMGTRKESITWDAALKQGLSIFWRYLGLTILTGIILVISFILLIVPFFIVAPRLMLAPYFLIDKKMGIIDSLKASWDAYKAHKGTWGIIGVFILINLPSIIPFVGWLVSNVLTFLYGPSLAVRYQQVLNLSAGKPAKTPIEEAPAASNA